MSEIDARSAIDAWVKASEKLTESLHRKVEISKLKAEVEHQKAIAEAMLDSLHKLGEDYRRALEEEQQHIRLVKVETVKEIGKKIIDNCHKGVISAVDVLDIVVDYVKECEEDE